VNAAERLVDLVTPAPGVDVPLLESAASLIVDAYPAADPTAVVAQVRTWSDQLARRIAPDMGCGHRLLMLNHFFFEELGFAGNRDRYDDADNSYLNRVIERRRGIPISLSVLYIEIGRALGLRLAGIAFPGHFLVRLERSTGASVIDVFYRGSMLSEGDLQRRLQAAYAGAAPHPLPVYLRPAAHRDVLVRWLTNLKRIHANAHDWARLLKVADRLVALRPAAVEERRDRALAYELLECPRAAADDLAAYLAARPDAGDAAEIRERLARLRRASRRLN
jgi:regulator of sirC expression with transglutaminase-like and TPR domain